MECGMVEQWLMFIDMLVMADGQGERFDDSERQVALAVSDIGVHGGEEDAKHRAKEETLPVVVWWHINTGACSHGGGHHTRGAHTQMWRTVA